MSQTSGTVEIEHILSLDFSDPFNEDYSMVEKEGEKEHKPFGKNSHTIIDHNDCVVEATNQAAKLAKGDILIYLSDDFKCPKNWDLLLVEKFKDLNRPALIKVDDCLQKFHVPVLTIPIMNSLLFKKLGYFWHPGYRSMFVDEDLFWVCETNGFMIYAPDLQFPHEHPANGKAQSDETYKRSSANWDQGKAMFAKRKQEGFKLP
jgi:hypothetical protein